MSNVIQYEDWRQEEVRGDLSWINRLTMEREVFQMLQPRLEKDGNQWCCIWGHMPELYIAGFGDTPAKAVSDFFNSYHNQKA